MANFVQLYRSTDVGAPVLNGITGSMITLLDTCLVNGYTTLSVTSIARSGTTATVTLGASNSTLRTDDYILIGGAVETEYNGTFQITVTGTSTFNYQVAGSPTTPATGTILYNKAGLGWTIPFTGTNKRVYQSVDAASNQLFLRVDDSTVVGNVREAYARGYETMSDIDTGTGPFPTVAQEVNGPCWMKSQTADATARVWELWGDDKTFYLKTTTVNKWIHGFGHVTSTKPADGYNTFCAGMPTSFSNFPSVSGHPFGSFLCASGTWGSTGLIHVKGGGFYWARGYGQTGGSVIGQSFEGRTYSGTTMTTTIGGATGGLPYPHGPDSGLWVAPVYGLDYSGATMVIRGAFPGIYAHLHSILPQNEFDIVTGVVGLSGRKLMAIPNQSYNNSAQAVIGQIHIDLTGPWA